MSGSNYPITSTNVPSVTFTATGYNAPAESDISTGALEDLQNAFQANFNASPATPQGQIAASLAAMIGDQNAVFCYLASQFDPKYAVGRNQDAIGRLYFMTRNPAVATVVTCTVTGNVGTVLQAGTLAQDTAGNTYALIDAVTFTQTNEPAQFANIQPGATPCPAGTLTEIYQAIPGWLSITNPADGVIGSAVESRSAFELRRQQSVALNAVNSVNAIQAAVLSVSGVLDAYTVANNSSQAATVGGVSIPANSIFVCAAGGEADAVAQAIFSKSPPGVPTVGSTTVTVQDTQAGYAPPYPSYGISFTEAASTPIYFNVTLTNNSGVPTDAATLIQNAIVSAFAGQNGGARARIGGTIYASQYYAGVAALGSWVQIVEITVGATTNPTTALVGVNINQIPAISATNISVSLQ